MDPYSDDALATQARIELTWELQRKYSVSAEEAHQIIMGERPAPDSIDGLRAEFGKTLRDMFAAFARSLSRRTTSLTVEEKRAALRADVDDAS